MALNDATLVSCAWAAKDTLHRWDNALARQEPLTAGARVTTIISDPLTNPDHVDYAAQIHHYAKEVILRHQRFLKLIEGGRLHGGKEQHTDAVAAWRLVMKTRDRVEIERRLQIATDLSGRVVARARRVWHPEEWE